MLRDRHELPYAIVSFRFSPILSFLSLRHEQRIQDLRAQSLEHQHSRDLYGFGGRDVQSRRERLQFLGPYEEIKGNKHVLISFIFHVQRREVVVAIAVSPGTIGLYFDFNGKLCHI